MVRVYSDCLYKVYGFNATMHCSMTLASSGSEFLDVLIFYFCGSFVLVFFVRSLVEEAQTLRSN